VFSDAEGKFNLSAAQVNAVQDPQWRKYSWIAV